MSEAKHTEGGWQAAENYSRSGAEYSWEIKTDDGRLIGNAITFYPDRTASALEELEANARLFAASKDLLAACRQLVDFQESTDLDDESEDGEYGDGKRAMIAARAAIAKTTANPLS